MLYLCTNMKLNKFLRIDRVEKGCRDEFQYLYVWRDLYKCCDATFLNLSGSRKECLKKLENHIHKLRYINPYCTDVDVIDDITDVLKSKISDGVRILESDVWNIAYEVFKRDIPTNIYEIVHSYKKVEWKDNISSLLVLTEDQYGRYLRLDEDKRKDYKKQILRNIKMNEARNCISKVKSDDNYEKVMVAIDVLREGSNDYLVSVKDVCDTSKLSEPTVRKYLDKCCDNLNSINGYTAIKNKRIEMVLEKDNELFEACLRLKDKGRKINKLQLFNETGIARATIDKHWSKVEEFLNTLK